MEYSNRLADGPGQNGFNDFNLIHNCLPGLAAEQINLSTSVAGIGLKHPVIINAVTGGAADVQEVNENLAVLARQTGAAMAVGSQYAAFEHPEVEESYKIVRQMNPDGVLWANLGAHATLKDARAAIDMIGACALQIHLNAPQELVMAEGDRDFRGYLENIAAIATGVTVPVIVKEVGCGIAREQARLLMQAGVKAIDVGGVGGTNFLAIEAARSNNNLSADLLNWGIPTAVSAVEIASVLTPGVDLIVSGGIRTPMETVKSLAIGGRAIGIAGPLVKILGKQGLAAAKDWLDGFLYEIRVIMHMLGAAEISDLRKTPLVITGKSREWFSARNIQSDKYANR